MEMERSRKFFWILIDVVLVVVIALGFVGVKAFSRYAGSLQPGRTISVSAEGKSVVVPDIAKINFGVVAEGKDPVALQKNNTKMADAIKSLKEAGIADKDIKTTQYNLSPRYRYDDKLNRSFIDGYILNQSAEVKIRDFAKISDILARLTKLGVNEISQVSFDVDDQDAYLDAARKEAFEKARAKAEMMAKANGTSIRRVVTFSENTGGYPIYYRALESKVGGGMGGDLPPAPQIEPGSQEITVNVNVVYEIR